MIVMRDEEHACGHFEAKFDPNASSANLSSMPYLVAGDQDQSGIKVVFPFPACDEWLEARGTPRVP
jgi:hypothetical protein